MCLLPHHPRTIHENNTTNTNTLSRRVTTQDDATCTSNLVGQVMGPLFPPPWTGLKYTYDDDQIFIYIIDSGIQLNHDLIRTPGIGIDKLENLIAHKVTTKHKHHRLQPTHGQLKKDVPSVPNGNPRIPKRQVETEVTTPSSSNGWLPIVIMKNGWVLLLPMLEAFNS